MNDWDWNALKPFFPFSSFFLFFSFFPPSPFFSLTRFTPSSGKVLRLGSRGKVRPSLPYDDPRESSGPMTKTLLPLSSSFLPPRKRERERDHPPSPLLASPLRENDPTSYGDRASSLFLSFSLSSSPFVSYLPFASGERGMEGGGPFLFGLVHPFLSLNDPQIRALRGDFFSYLHFHLFPFHFLFFFSLFSLPCSPLLLGTR